ncbi:MAG: hypothetical protein K2J67_05835 [Lachnospiraceae bacterium]|nr:hypothetical protein [Lachnospiraceae bacterium]
MKQIKIHRNYITAIKILIIFLCTIVGCYGIATAPESDQSALEQELAHNAEMLEEKENLQTAQETEITETNDDNNPSPSTISPTVTATPAESISVIGDSVFLGAALSYQKLVPNAVIDAKISRQVYHGLDVAKKLAKKDKLGSTVLIALGTNGKFNEVTGQELIDYLGKERTIYWITAYGKKLSWQKEVNQTIRKLADKNENVSVISWEKEAKKHPNWFYQDGTHLNTKGQTGYAQFIVKETKEPGAR